MTASRVQSAWQSWKGEVVLLCLPEESDRGLPSSKANVRDVADNLLRERRDDAVGKSWVDRFIHRTPELRMPWTRPYDRQQTVCEDPAVIQSWSTLVQSMEAKHSIVDKDMYDFDKFGFLTGKVSSQLVGRGSEKPGWEAVETPTYRSRVDYPGKTCRVDGDSRLP